MINIILTFSQSFNLKKKQPALKITCLNIQNNIVMELQHFSFISMIKVNCSLYLYYPSFSPTHVIYQYLTLHNSSMWPNMKAMLTQYFKISPFLIKIYLCIIMEENETSSLFRPLMVLSHIGSRVPLIIGEIRNYKILSTQLSLIKEVALSRVFEHSVLYFSSEEGEMSD